MKLLTVPSDITVYHEGLPQVMAHNARLEALFLAKRAEFLAAGKSTRERLGFHGTTAANARGIIEQVAFL